MIGTPLQLQKNYDLANQLIKLGSRCALGIGVPSLPKDL